MMVYFSLLVHRRVTCIEGRVRGLQFQAREKERDYKAAAADHIINQSRAEQRI